MPIALFVFLVSFAPAASTTTTSVLATSFPEDEVSALIENLTNKKADVRRQAALDLGKLRRQASPALPSLCQAAFDDNPKVSAAALSSLGDIGIASPLVLETLEKAARTGEGDPSKAAVTSLADLGAPSLPVLQRLLESLGDVPSNLGESIGRFGVLALPILERALQGDDVTTCRRSLQAFGHLHADSLEMEAKAIALLQDPDPGVREDAARALGRRKRPSEEVLKAFEAMAADSDEALEVRVAALKGLEEMKMDAFPSLPLLKHLSDFRHREPSLAVAALRAWEATGEESTAWRKKVVGYVSQPRLPLELRRGAVELTRGHWTPNALSGLQQAARSKDASLRALACWSLSTNGDRDSSDTLKILNRCARDSDPTVRERALRGLTFDRGEDRTLKVFYRALKDDDPDVRYQALRQLSLVENPSKTVLRKIASVLDDESTFVRLQAAAHLLENDYEEETARETLFEGLETNVSWALFYLDRAGDLPNAIVQRVLELSQTANDFDRANAIRTLHQLEIEHDTADERTFLTQLLEHHDYRRRQEAVETLGEIGDSWSKAKTLLIEACRDVSWEVRRTALQSLHRFEGRDVAEQAALGLQDDHVEVRLTAIYSLYELDPNDPYTREGTMLSLSDASPRVREIAASKADELPEVPKKLFDTLIRLTKKDPHSSVRQRATWTVRNIRRDGKGAP